MLEWLNTAINCCFGSVNPLVLPALLEWCPTCAPFPFQLCYYWRTAAKFVMEMKQIIFSLYWKGSKEGVLSLKLFFPLKASGCLSQSLGSSNTILIYRFPLNEQKSLFTARKLLWCQLLLSRMNLRINFHLPLPIAQNKPPLFFVTSITRATRAASFFFLFFDLISHTHKTLPLYLKQHC